MARMTFQYQATKVCQWCKRPFRSVRLADRYCSRRCTKSAKPFCQDKRFAGKERGHSSFEWSDLLEAWGWKCFYCGEPIDLWNATKDHNIPVSRGGSDRIENIVPACRPCNLRKGTMTAEEFISRGQR